MGVDEEREIGGKGEGLDGFLIGGLNLNIFGDYRCRALVYIGITAVNFVETRRYIKFYACLLLLYVRVKNGADF